MRQSAIVIAVILLAGAAWPADITVLYNGSPLAVTAPPIQVGGRVLVAMRDIFEAMSASLEWNQATQTVTATQGGTTVVLTIGGKTATVNGRPVQLDVPAQVVADRTYVPLRFIAEATGAEVKWLPQTMTVAVTTGGGQPPSTEPGGPLPAPAVTSPAAGQTVGSGVDVKGQTVGGAMIQIVTYVYKKSTREEVSRVPGIRHNVWADGSFDFHIALPSGGSRGKAGDLYYDIHVRALKAGQQSADTVVRVYRNG